MSIDQMIDDFFETTKEIDQAITSAITKNIERWTIQTVYAPIKKIKSASILNTYNKQMKSSGDELKLTIDSIAEQLDSNMKGQFSKKVQSVMKETAKEYDAL